eukprot:TRINITY_DN266_c0_g1_i4.p1 TRINITY_DN266_c0_g1~~TRINITY_DN266_c0_g1_i4.p1  ORF type:complete len:168 (+),score=48.02 TRINITY_DN266_c0_g1_i4:68-571(+)
MCIRDRQKMGCNTHGYRRRTRDKFARAFKQHGVVSMKKLLATYKKGDYVDIKVDGSAHKGMPYKWYHGRTGQIFNVNPRSVGIYINKQVRNRMVRKIVHARIEHVCLSRCRENFIKRTVENDKKKAEAKKKGQILSTKRQPVQPAESHTVKATIVEYQNPRVFQETF